MHIHHFTYVNFLRKLCTHVVVLRVQGKVHVYIHHFTCVNFLRKLCSHVAVQSFRKTNMDLPLLQCLVHTQQSFQQKEQKLF